MKSFDTLKEEVNLEFRRLDLFDRMIIDNFLEQAFILGKQEGSNQAFDKYMEIKSDIESEVL
jgi:hypothetical protein